ncbi:hypothetical protein ACP275_05G118600 [Erythranthe tilingii]
MSGTAAPVMAVGVGGGEMGYGGFTPPFTAMQWQELEQQAMIYKYLVAGMPVPPDLVMPIRRSLEVLSARFFNHPAMGYCSYYGKKFDPEPGRCRRTDGKKWRCSKDAHSDSKYCERHMHRGRNRSRKPVESTQSNTTSQSFSTAMSNISTNNNNNNGSFLSNGGGSFQDMQPLYSAVRSEGLTFESSVKKLQMETNAYAAMDNKDFRYIHGLATDADDSSFSPEASRSMGLGPSVGSSSSKWRLTPSQYSSSSLFKQRSDPPLLDHHYSPAPQTVPTRGFHSTDINFSKPNQQQHCFFGSDNNGIVLKQENQQQQPVHLFFSEWPTTKESQSNLDEEGSNPSVFSSTQLSISIPSASSSFSSRSAYSANDD